MQVNRKAKDMDPFELVPVLKKVQQDARQCNAKFGKDARGDTLTACYLNSSIAAVDRLQGLWYPPLRKIRTVALETGNEPVEGQASDLVEFLYSTLVEDGPFDGPDLIPLPTVDAYNGEKLPGNPLLVDGPIIWSQVFDVLLKAGAGANTDRVKLSEAQLAPIPAVAAGIVRLSEYQQYEAAGIARPTNLYPYMYNITFLCTPRKNGSVATNASTKIFFACALFACVLSALVKSG